MADVSKTDDSTTKKVDTQAANTIKVNKPNDVAVIYIGPNLKKNGLNQYTVFKDGIPKSAGDNTALKHLFVPVDELNKAMSNLKTKGSLLSTFYNQALGGND